MGPLALSFEELYFGQANLRTSWCLPPWPPTRSRASLVECGVGAGSLGPTAPLLDLNRLKSMTHSRCGQTSPTYLLPSPSTTSPTGL
jgi:hypothetical protein